MRALKIFALAAGVVGIALIAGAAALLAWFDPNDYKDYVTRWAEARTGRHVAIGGKLELQVFPWLAVQTSGITIGNADGFGAEPFATAAHAAAEVRLLPLLEKRIEVGTVRLDGVQLHLERDAAGRGNWEDFLAKPAVAQTPGSSAPGPTGMAAAPGWLDAVNVAGVRISNSRIEWRDAAGPHYVVDGLELSTGPIRAGLPIAVTAGFEARDVASQRSAAIEAHAVATLHGTRVEFGKTRIEAHLAGMPIDGGNIDAALGWTEAAFDPAAGALHVQGLSTSLAGLAAVWKLDADNLFGAPTVSGHVGIESGSAAAAFELLGLAPPPGVDAKGLGTFDAAADFRTELAPAANSASDVPITAEVTGIHAAWLGVALRGRARLSDAGKLDASLEIPPFAPNATLLALARARLPASIDLAAMKRLGFSGRLTGDLDNRSFSLSDVKAELLGATVTGGIETVPQAGTNVYRGTLKTTRFAPNEFAAVFARLLSDKIVPAKLGTLALDTTFTYDPAHDALSLAPLQLEAFGLAAAGRLSASHLAGTPVLKGQARLATFSPRDLLRRFGQPPPVTADPKALQRASIATDFEIDPGQGHFTNMVLALDDSRISGDFTVEGIRNPEYRFALAIDRVDADRYLPPPAPPAPKGAARPRPADTAPTAGDIELPAEALSTLKLDGSIKVGKLKLANLDLDEVATNVAVGNGEARLSKAGAKLYGGRFDGSFEVKAAGKQPGLTLEGRGKSLELAPLITALTREKANFSGKGDFDLALSGHGTKIIDNVRSADGKVSFALKNGAIDGFNLGRTLCAVYNASQKLPGPAAQPAVTRYELVSGTAEVANGVASSSDLLARASFMDVKGRGKLKLAEQGLDYELEAKMTGKIGIRGCESMDGLVGESIPLTLRGTVTNPDIRPDFTAIIQRRVKKQLKQRLENRILKGLLK